MRKKQSSYIAYELEFLEKKVQELRDYIEQRPFSELKDRTEWKSTKTGGSFPVVVATIEAQRKDLTAAMKEYSEMLFIVKRLKIEAEEEEKTARGSSDVPFRMR